MRTLLPPTSSFHTSGCCVDDFDVYINFTPHICICLVHCVFSQGCLLRHSQGYINSGLLNSADGYPTLCCKAYNGRLLLIFLDRCVHDLADRPSSSSNPELAVAAVAARSLAAWFDLLERSPRFLNAEQRVGLHAFACKYVQSLERLAVISLLTHTSRWKLQPKIHAFIHIAEDHLAFGYNYRFCHTYIDEDHIGLTKRLALKVHRGDLMELRVVCRWLLRLGSWLPGGGD